MGRVFDVRRTQHPLEKQCIGVYTAFYLRKTARHRPIAVDGGSTNLSVLQAISRDAEDGRPTVSQVLTNHLEGIFLVRNLPDGVPPLWRCTGGILRASRAAFVDGAEEAVREYSFVIAVVGVNGFKDSWLQTSTKMEHSVKKTMVYGASNEILFPIDSSKWGYPAGQHLFTPAEIVSWGKRVSLITCYPVQMEEEAPGDFLQRVDDFLREVNAFSQEWPYKADILTVPVRPEDSEFSEQALDSTEDLGAALKNVYLASIAEGEQRKVGLVIVFNLWDKPC